MSKKKKKKTINKKTNNIFIGIYIALLLLIIILGFRVYKLNKNSKKDEAADIVVSVVKNNSIDFNIVIDNLKKGKSINYIIKVNNYKNNKVNKKDIVYNMEFLSENKFDLKLYKNNQKKNILLNNKAENLKIVGKSKKETIYQLNIKAKENIKHSVLEVVITN